MVMAAAELAMALADWERVEDPPGRRAELLSGVLRMNPAPRPVHQHVVRLLTNAFADACGPNLLAVFDVEWRIPAATPETLHHAPRPDVLVADALALRGHVAFAGEPLIVVEVLSPGNRKADLDDKKAVYFDNGACHYVQVHAEDEQAVSIVWSIRGTGGWDPIAEACGDAVLAVDDPFRLRLRPDALLF